MAQLSKKDLTLDDLFNTSSLMKASLRSEYENFKALSTSDQTEKVTFDQCKEAIQYNDSFDYKSIKDKQIDKEFWVNLGIGEAIVVLTIACPPAGAVAGVAYGAMQMSDAVTGKSWISGRELSTGERVSSAAFGALDVIPGAEAAGAFGTIGRASMRSAEKVADLTKTLGQASKGRLIQLRQISRSWATSVQQTGADLGDRLSLGGLQPEFAGAPGVRSDEGFIQNVKNSFRQMASKENVNHPSSYSKIEEVRGKNGAVTPSITKEDSDQAIQRVTSTSRGEYLRKKYGTLTSEELNSRINIRGINEEAIKYGTKKTWNVFLDISRKSGNESIEDIKNSYIKLIKEQSPWPEGFSPINRILQPGDTFEMVLDSDQPLNKPGNFGTFDNIKSVEFARNQLAIKSDWKEDLGRVVTFRVNKISGKISWKYNGNFVAIYCKQIQNAKIFNNEKLVMVINKVNQKSMKLLIFDLDGTPLFQIEPPNDYQLLYFSSVNNKPSVVCESSTLHDKYGRNTWQFIIDTKAGKLLKSNLAY